MVEIANTPNQHDWRVWYEPTTTLWHVTRWDRIGGVLTADTLQCSAHFVTDGRYMRIPNAECKVGTVKYIHDQNVHVPRVRLIPNTQTVKVPVVGAARGSARGG